MNKVQKAKIYFLLFLCLIGVFLIFKNELKLLFLPDPEKEMIYKNSFQGSSTEYARNVTEVEGFIAGDQGLQLLPGSSGRIVFSFDKELYQGCLLRIWFYGDGGAQRPNAVKISGDEGETFHKVADSGNYVGEVFDLSSYVKGSNNFHLLFEAENHAPFTTVVFDTIEVVVAKGELAKPQLPNLPKIIGLILLLLVIFSFALKRDLTGSERLTIVLLMFIILLAAYWRWNELIRISGTILDEDAIVYLNYAKKMDLFSDNGFYSAQFGKREPLYIFVIRMNFLFLGISDTHLRFASFVFSLIAIFLAYRIGKEWFNGVVGLTAAFILSIHPYLINLSARGFRAEWFTTLLLLFIYYGYVKTAIPSCLRVLITGLITGCILLTRSECLPMLVIILMFYPLLARPKWNYRMVFITLIIGVLLLIPQIYGIYKEHGSPFYTVNQYARFYANREFMGEPGFPTREEIVEKGMYAGPRISPIEYYFKLHTPWQCIKYSIVGFAKTHLRMPFCFVSGRGNFKKVLFRLDKLKKEFGKDEIIRFIELSLSLLRENIWGSFMGILVFVTFIWGLVLIGISRHWMLYVYMIFFQMQTAFIAYLGVDLRLSIHAYPLITFCCGFTLYWIYQWFLRKRAYSGGLCS